MNRKQALAKIWRETHRDYKGKIGDTKTVMVLRLGGSTLVALEGLSDAEIKSRAPEYAGD